MEPPAVVTCKGYDWSLLNDGEVVRGEGPPDEEGLSLLPGLRAEWSPLGRGPGRTWFKGDRSGGLSSVFIETIANSSPRAASNMLPFRLSASSLSAS